MLILDDLCGYDTNNMLHIYLMFFLSTTHFPFSFNISTPLSQTHTLTNACTHTHVHVHTYVYVYLMARLNSLLFERGIFLLRYVPKTWYGPNYMNRGNLEYSVFYYFHSHLHVKQLLFIRNNFKFTFTLCSWKQWYLLRQVNPRSFYQHLVIIIENEHMLKRDIYHIVNSQMFFAGYLVPQWPPSKRIYRF